MTTDHSILNALKLVERNKGKKKLKTFVKMNGIKTIGDITKFVKKSRNIEGVEIEMLHSQIKEDMKMEIIMFKIPDKVFVEKQKEIENVISEADEKLGRIDESIVCYKETETDADIEWVECWLEDMEQDFDIHPEDHIVKDTAVIKDIKERIWNSVYNENCYNHLSCAFVNVENLLVLKIGDIYYVHTYVEHGVSDCEESRTTYSDTFDFKMKMAKDGKMVYYKEEDNCQEENE